MTSHFSPFISLPRKTTGETDFSGPIRQTIGQVYGERPDGYADDIATLTRCRGDAVKGAGSDVTARDLLFKYFGQLELLELRFAETKISFLWNDAYTQKPTTQTSLAFEKASILHLLSSVLSHLGATSPRTSPEGVKRAYASLRQAAGLLNFINENFLHAPSTDLSREVVSLSGKLMIAQAGETFLEKCISEKKPIALVSKMCQSVAQSYAALTEDAKEFQGKGIIDRNWVNVFGIKAKHFASLAQWYRAEVDTGKGDYGTGLVRYGMAEKLAIEAHKLAKEFSYSYTPTTGVGSTYTTSVSWGSEDTSVVAHSTLPFDAATALLEITKAHLAVSTESKTTANKDNDLIYHALAPSESTLPAIEPLPSAGLAAPITIQEIYAQPAVSGLIGPDIFRRLVPLEVHEKASVYSEEKAKLVRAEQERCDIGEGETRAALDDLRVRERIHRFRSILDGQDGEQGGPSGGLPREVAAWADEISGRERRDGSIEDAFRRNDQRRNQAQEELSGMARELDEESRECEKLRARHGHLWTMSPSSSHNRQYKDQIKSNLDSLNSASSSDRTIADTWNTIKWSVDVLRGPRHVLERMYTDADAGKDSSARLNLLDVEVAQEELDEKEKDDLRNVIAELQERVDRIEKVRRERDEVLKDLKEKIQTDDVSHLLLLNRRSQGVEPTLFASELEKFSPYQDRISAALGSQSGLIDEMAILIKQAESGRGVREAQRKLGGAAQRRDDLDRRFRAAYEGYVDARTDLEKGSHFYNSLSTLTDSLRRQVRGLITSRTQERNQLVSNIEARSAGGAPRSPSYGGADDLESALSGMSLGSRSPPPPSPYQTQQYGSSPAPPPAPRQNPPSNPYDFGSFGSLPSAFSSDPRSSASTNHLPPPPPKAPSAASGGTYNYYSAQPPTHAYPDPNATTRNAHPSSQYSQATPSSGYPASLPPPSTSPYAQSPASGYPSAFPPPPPSNPYGSYGAPAGASPYPPPPPSQQTRSPPPPAAYPSYGQPASPGSHSQYSPYGAPPPPPAPPGQGSGGYGGYQPRPY